MGHKYQMGLAALAAGFVATALYWPTLALPLLYDDLLHIRIASELNLASVWRPTEAFGFYRPLTFFPLLVIKQLFGYYPHWLLHGLNVGQHAFNAGLVVLLSWRLWRRRSWALAAGLLFAVFSFSYQAVAVYGHNVHPAIAGLFLLGLHTYLSAINTDSTNRDRDRDRDRTFVLRPSLLWWLLTGFLFLLMLLTHETAVLFGPLAALVHWNRRGFNISYFHSLKVTLRANPWVLFLLLGGLYVIGYQFLPIGRPPQEVAEDGGLWLKVLYLLQAAAYPFTWFAHRLPALPAAAVILGGVTLTLALTAWAARQKPNQKPLLSGWAWFGLAMLVIALPLPAGYLLHGPRLFYLGSVGLALLWPVLLEPVRRLPRAGLPLWGMFLAFILSTNWLFVRDRLHAYAQITSPVSVVQTVMAERPRDEGILLVNLPQWFSPPRNKYAIGAEFVAMLGDYLFVEELMADNLGVDRPVRALKVPELLTDPGYGYGVHEQMPLTAINGDWAPAGSHVFVTRYREDGIEIDYTGRIGPPAEEGPPLAHLGPYSLVSVSATCNDKVQVVLTWQPAVDNAGSLPIAATISTFVQLLDDSGRLVAQADGPPLGLRPDLVELTPGWQIIDHRSLQPARPGPMHLLIGLYDYASGERLPALDEQGRPLPDKAFPIPLTGCFSGKEGTDEHR